MAQADSGGMDNQSRTSQRTPIHYRAEVEAEGLIEMCQDWSWSPS